MIFGRGRLKEAEVAEELGTEEAIAASIPLLMPAAPVAPALIERLVPLDLDTVLAGEAPRPVVDLSPVLDRLAPIVPSDWRPASGTQTYGEEIAAVSYLELSKLDVAEPLGLAERLADLIKHSR